jgi:DNA polymerase-3 subunit epsilon
MYAIVDIETTGGYAAAHGITEISIHVFDGNKVVEKFETLVNPLQPIPRYIQAFTGISDEMVATAPTFEKVAEKIYTLLADKIFVAHNVNFDYSFVKSHLAEAGFTLHCKKLCTVRMSRKIFPGLPSYSLGNLCQYLNIKNNARHRAGGDTEATVQVLKLLLENDKEKYIEKSLLKNSKEQLLPPHVCKEDFEKLPATPGVYYFCNEKGKIIYVGKAKNIRSRVNSHFSNNSESRQKQNFMKHIHSIRFQSCGTELMAHILESAEIKKHWPLFNYSQKKREDEFGIYCYEDQKGYLRLAIEKNKKQLARVFTFHYLVEGHALLRKLLKEFNLCPKLCFLQTNNPANREDECEGIKEGYCFGACCNKEKPVHYNKRVLNAIQLLQEQPSFAIIEKGLTDDELSCILVWNGKFYGMGYIPADTPITEPEILKGYLTQYRENSFIRNIIQGYAARYPSRVVQLQCASIQSSH